ncbi:MAG: type II secretion system protein GspG [Candidatus Hydrogenedentota bacterium]
MTSTSNDRASSGRGKLLRWTLAGTGVIVVLAAIAIAAAWWMSQRLPAEAPLARMYRTEADLWMLRHAIEQYHDKNGVYPPPGKRGLEKAIETLGQGADYLPGGPPPDGWGRPFHYVPHTAYGENGAEAFQSDGHYEAAASFQLFSPGASGEPGFDDPEARRDTITSWEPDRPWRTTYHKLNEAFMKDWRKPK